MVVVAVCQVGVDKDEQVSDGVSDGDAVRECSPGTRVGINDNGEQRWYLGCSGGSFVVMLRGVDAIHRAGILRLMTLRS